MSQGRARAALISAKKKAEKELYEQYKSQVEANQAAQERSLWGGILGSIGLPALGAWLAPLTGGLSLGVGAALSAIGSRVGSELGEHIEGKWWEGDMKWGEGVDTSALDPVGFGADTRMGYEQNIEDTFGGFDDKQDQDAIRAGLTALIAGGVKDAWAKSGSVELPVPEGFQGPPELIEQSLWDRAVTTAKTPFDYSGVVDYFIDPADEVVKGEF